MSTETSVHVDWLLYLSGCNMLRAEEHRKIGNVELAKQLAALHILRREQARTLAKQANAVKP